MSIKLMSAIFEAEFHDLEYVKDGEIHKAKASTSKLVLLAIADHANDEGEAYPGYTRLETKTALSRQGLADTLDALEYNGLLSIGKKRSRLNTNDYTINIRSLPAIARELPDIINQQESSHLTSKSQVALPTIVKPLDLNHQLTINQPSLKKSKKGEINFRELRGPADYRKIPELKSFMDATEWIPGSFVLEVVYEFMHAGIDPNNLRDAFKAWTARGYKPSNVQGYLTWARDGIPPTKTTTPMSQKGGYYPQKQTLSDVKNDLAGWLEGATNG